MRVVYVDYRVSFSSQNIVKTDSKAKHMQQVTEVTKKGTRARMAISAQHRLAASTQINTAQ
jgi:hypothetical protein